MTNSFLQQTAQSIIQTIEWKDLRNTTLVLPSHRAGLVLKDELMRLQQQRHTQAVWAPQVQTLTQLQDALSPLYAEDELFTIVRLYKIYLQSPITDHQSPIMPLDMFYGWGRQMLADFTNIDASMQADEVPNFFDNTIAAHELEQWTLDPETEERLRSLMAKGEKRTAGEDSVKAQYEQLWHQLYNLYTALRQQMSAEQKGYAGMRQRAVIEQWDSEAIQQQIAGRTYVFVGFNYLLPVEFELMKRLRDAGQARFYWDYIPDFPTNEKAFSFAQLNAQRLGNNLSPFTFHLSPSNPLPVTVISCVSREAQAQYVHRWLQENYTAKGQKVGVVICDETMLESVIYTLPPIVLPGETEPAPINITKGFPLRNTAVYARVLAWFNDPKRGQADTLVTPTIIDELLADIFPTREEEPQTSNTQTSNPLSWQELLILESEYQVRKVANQMRLLLTEGLGEVPFTLKLLRLVVRRTMENITMPFHGEPVTDIQIMGVLETRMLDFDKLLLLNVEEGIIPQRQADCSFIPFYLRKTYHMQTSDEKATIYAYNFFRLLSRAGHSTLLYATAETAEGGKGASRFIIQMQYSPDFNVLKKDLQEPGVVESGQTMEVQPVSLLSLLEKDDKGVLRRSGGKRYCLSPSALNTFISCPRSFYLQYILDLKPKEEDELFFSSATTGSFVHLMMEYIYTRFLHCDNTGPKPVLPDEIEAIRTDEARLQEALEAAYKTMNERYQEDHPEEPNYYILPFHSSENVTILGYVKNILERDREDAKTGLQIYLLEQGRFFPIPIDGVGEVLTGGTIDRLDILGAEGNQKLRIVDYKSGGYNDTTHAKKMSSTWEEIMDSEDKGYVRQTLIYSHAVMTEDRTGLPIEPNLYFCRRKLTNTVTTVDVQNETISDYRTIHQPFYEALKTKAAQVLTTTDFPQCEPDKCPSFCPFFRLCGRKPIEY